MSLFATHPPDGLRARIIESRPRPEPAVALATDVPARIDRELAAHYEYFRHDIIGG